MFADAFSYPLDGEDTLRNLLIGGALTFGGAVFVVPLLPLYGYYLAVIRAVLAGDPLPQYDDWEALTVEGLQAALVLIAYSLVAAVPIGIGVAVLTGGFLVVAADAASAAALGVGAVTVLFALVAVLLATAAAYLAPIALVRFALEDDLGAAFEIRTIAAIAYDATYAVVWLFVSVVIAVLGAIAGLLSIVLVGFLLTYYLQVVAVYLFARGYESGVASVPDASRPDA
jgi:lysylphosphatidylglycerol synthetase-like protein (DUF2156 family)